ncbi:SctD/MshK family protein [Methylobacterium brachythecii]|uniref:Type III secretion protein D n=1 Tax=Methylobacterium brachythecii TaxID=1176177 RepID=A0A7W6AH91_9HYPH|nr:EscD/YscD/HrpQ family type III secretion system periplasmic domain-containing protein [Methylobacterium brachythecii]MBB3903308.1 type III secretion protein D [Methylobacterium brachythecii]GLS46842.1 hypothetical protein GCM10007884_48390 [Methylobacterium brachythecii]
MAALSQSYLLEIGTGIYQGVTHELDAGRYVVGNGEDADLVLLEPGLAARHATFVLHGSTLRVEGIGDDVTVHGAGPVPADAARTVALPAVVDIGALRLSWRVAEMPVATEETSDTAGRVADLRRLMRRPAVPGLIAAGFLAATVLLTIANPIAGAAVLLDGSAKAVLAARQPQEASDPVPTMPSQPVTAHERLQDLKPARALTPTASGPGALEKASNALKRDVELAGLLNVSAEPSAGAVSANGTIEPSMLGRWQAIQQSFDERFAGEITLVNSVAVKAEKLPASLGIEGVWRGPQPYIVVRGQRYLVGAIVDGGWAIRAIDRDRVMLERDGRLVAMRF